MSPRWSPFNIVQINMLDPVTVMESFAFPFSETAPEKWKKRRIICVVDDKINPASRLLLDAARFKWWWTRLCADVDKHIGAWDDWHEGLMVLVAAMYDDNTQNTALKFNTAWSYYPQWEWEDSQALYAVKMMGYVANVKFKLCCCSFSMLYIQADDVGVRTTLSPWLQ